MIDGLVDLLENDYIIQYAIIFCLGYFLILWLIIPVWVFADSKKKYNNLLISIALFILIFPLNLPGFLFYIIIRPDEDHHLFEVESDRVNESALNIPIVNFISPKQELVLGLDLKINPKVLNHDERDLHLDVNLESKDDNIEISFKEGKSSKVEKTESKGMNVLSKLRNSITNALNNISVEKESDNTEKTEKAKKASEKESAKEKNSKSTKNKKSRKSKKKSRSKRK